MVGDACPRSFEVVSIGTPGSAARGGAETREARTGRSDRGRPLPVAGRAAAGRDRRRGPGRFGRDDPRGRVVTIIVVNESAQPPLVVKMATETTMNRYPIAHAVKRARNTLMAVVHRVRSS